MESLCDFVFINEHALLLRVTNRWSAAQSQVKLPPIQIYSIILVEDSVEI
jgi:hypothetical protein